MEKQNSCSKPPTSLLKLYHIKYIKEDKFRGS